MSEPIVIEYLGAPRGKERARFSSKTGRFYTPDKTRAHEGGIAWAAKVAMRGRPPIKGPVAVTVLAIIPVPVSWSKKRQAGALLGAIHPTGKPDLDNIAKGLDALNKIVWRDDSQIVEGRIFKRYGDKPGTTIEVKEI